MSALRHNYVLIDYENVQPKDLTLLKDGLFRVKVFLGSNQGKIPCDVARAIQPLGTSADYIPLKTAGPNALDFHVAFYLGELSCQEPSASFHIISKDQGFDPLIKHLRERGILVERTERIADMSCFEHAFSASVPAAHVDAVVADLKRRNSSKPRTLKTLRSTVHALFKKEASEEQLSKLIDHLCSQGIVKVDGAKISYDLTAGRA